MAYKGYKLLDKIILVCRDVPEQEEDDGLTSCYQAYLVDPANTKQLESARNWAKWTEYGPLYKNAEDKWEREYEIPHKPIEFEFDNTGFTLQLLDCAGGSSQGGKLSFWNCLVSKEDKTFKIGINSDMLLDLLKNAVFDKGVCQSPLIFITQKGKVGMTAEGSETYKQCVADRELKKTLKTSQVSKFEFGDILKTATIEEVYLGTMMRYYTFTPGDRYRTYHWSDFRDCTITKLAEPIKYHIFDTIYNKTRISDFSDSYSVARYSYPDFKKSCPKRAIDGKLELDITEEEFYKRVMEKFYDFDAYLDYYNKYYGRPQSEDTALYYFLGLSTFGYGVEPFELSEDLMKRIKAAGINYVDETAN